MNQVCRLTELKNKEVISVCDGSRIGYISDIEIDICAGKISAIIVPDELICFSFGKSNATRIPWEKIEKIGPEVILVSILPDECKSKKPEQFEGTKKHFLKDKKRMQK